jgi:hypothetical protein
MLLTAKRFFVASLLLAGSLRLTAQPAVTAPPAAQLLRVESVDAGSVVTPQYDVNVRGMSTQRDGRRSWLMVVSEYKTAPEWIDEVTVTFYVALRGDPEDLPEGAKPVNLFSGTVTYMNVKKGDHQATMFLDPNTFERFGEVEAVAVVINVDGQLAGGMADPRTTVKWWERETPNAIPLLKRNESPWALIEMEQHETIKP